MKQRYAWARNSDDELWHGGPCDSIRECVREASDEGYLEDDTIAIGLVEPYTIGIDYAWRIIEDLQEDAFEEVGDASDSWLDNVSREHRENLNARIHSVVNSWLEEISEKPYFYKILPIKECTLKEAMEFHNEKVASMSRGGKIDD